MEVDSIQTLTVGEINELYYDILEINDFSKISENWFWHSRCPDGFSGFVNWVSPYCNAYHDVNHCEVEAIYSGPGYFVCIERGHNYGNYAYTCCWSR